MRITPTGIQLNGDAMAMDTLMASHITSKPGVPLVVDSTQNITMTARDAQGRAANKIFLGKWCASFNAKLPGWHRRRPYYYGEPFMQMTERQRRPTRRGFRNNETQALDSKA